MTKAIHYCNYGVIVRHSRHIFAVVVSEIITDNQNTGMFIFSGSGQTCLLYVHLGQDGRGGAHLHRLKARLGFHLTQ